MSVVTLIGKLTHNAEIVQIKGEFYRLKESRERVETRQSRFRQTQKKEVQLAAICTSCPSAPVPPFTNQHFPFTF